MESRKERKGRWVDSRETSAIRGPKVARRVGYYYISDIWRASCINGTYEYAQNDSSSLIVLDVRWTHVCK